MSGEQTPFDAFQLRMTRLLADRRQRLDIDLNNLNAEIIRDNAATNIRSIFPKLELAKACAEDATDFVLGEASNFVDRYGSHHRGIWLTETAERSRTVLSEHLAATFGINWRLWPEIESNAAPHIDNARQAAFVAMNSEIDDYISGVWRPRTGLKDGRTTITNNTMNIHGNVSSSVIQQAGDAATQNATAGPDALTIAKALDDFAHALTFAELNPSTVKEIEAEIETMRAQLKKSTPNENILRIAVGAIANLSSGVTANVLTPHLLPLLQAVGLA